ncbi:hypothetical protein [Mixta intestinalis]|jgi:hypothetical protein|uniref:DUF5862 domain-containing protein n=1 Tax=Mixta intestinalis TaxID=1615494 RepID=A0A6P1Q465_9GAMM|nr:hypothetical protein [Mixta intestinalis]QHM73152.1 hypothetical protein C7M51_03497 [Mixta intestinalis]
MRELSVYEIQNVSGSGFFDSIGAMVLGASAGIIAGVAKFATIGGEAGGGLIGVGIIGSGVGAILGLIGGTVFGGLYGLVNGYDVALENFNNVANEIFDFAAPLPA